MRLTKANLIEELLAISHKDPEWAHARADELLIEHINDPEVKAAYEGITRWYA